MRNLFDIIVAVGVFLLACLHFGFPLAVAVLVLLFAVLLCDGIYAKLKVTLVATRVLFVAVVVYYFASKEEPGFLLLKEELEEMIIPYSFVLMLVNLLACICMKLWKKRKRSS